MKKLFLASEAKHPNSLNELEKFINGRLVDQKILYIPTAANGAGWGSWQDSRTLETLRSKGVSLDIVELENTLEGDVEKHAEGVDIIWMAGGMTGYLLYWLRRRRVDILLPQLLDRGVVYVGSSAGSMICATTQKVSDIFIDEEEPGASLLPGLGFIDFEIYPHFEDHLYDEIEKRWQNGRLCLLKNGENILIEGEKVTILGEERMLVKP
jgi:dipeptidase E